MPETEEKDGFTLTVDNVENERLRICSAYTGEKDKTGMVLIEVELVTGWEAVSLENLLNQVRCKVNQDHILCEPIHFFSFQDN